MAVTKYTYNKLCDSSRLSSEIQASAIVIAEDHIETSSAGITDVYMKDVLSQGDEGILDALITAHVNTPLEENEAKPVYLDSPNDIDSAPIVRVKAASAGWTYHLRGIEFETSLLSSVYDKDHLLQDLSHTTLTFKDVNGDTLTVQGDLDTDCTQTILDFEPPWDYEIIGGTVKTQDEVTTDTRIWVVGVPDIPAGSGGSKVMVNGVNLKFINARDGIEADGRASKFMTYNITYHTNKLRLLVTHPAGQKLKIQLLLEMFKL